MYIFEDQIRANIRATFLLFFLFNLVVGGMGYLAGYLLRPGMAWTITLVALGVALVSSIFSWWQGRSLALRATGAKPASPEEYPYLHNVLEGLCIAAGLDHVPDVYIVDEPSPNAFAAGRGPEDSVVAVTSGLVERMDRQELEGVLAHELSHIYNRDTLIMTLAAVLAGTVILLSDFVLRTLFYGGSGESRKGHPIMLVVALIVLILAPIFSRMIKMTVSRKREYLADATAVSLTRNNEGLASALEKLQSTSTSVENAHRGYSHLFISQPKVETSWLDRMLSTHPPLDERIKRLRGMTDDEWGQYQRVGQAEPYSESTPEEPPQPERQAPPAEEIPPHELGI